MKISGREKMLLVVTCVIVCAVIVYKFGINRIYEGLRFSTEQLQSAENTYQRYVRQMEHRKRIEREYNEIEDQFPTPEAGRDPAHQFSEEIDMLCSQLGFANPTIEPAKEKPIEDVEDYRFILLTVKTEGDFSSITRMLKGFDNKSLLIRELALNNYPDKDRVRVAVTVARIVKADETLEGEAGPDRPKARRITETSGEDKVF